MNNREEKIRTLWKNRPRRPFLRWSLFLLLGLGLFSWFSGEIDVAGLFSENRIDNLDRFVTEEVVPHPTKEGGSAWVWAKELFKEKGGAALLATFYMSVIAILLAGLAGLLLALPAARNFMKPDPSIGARVRQARDGT